MNELFAIPSLKRNPIQNASANFPVSSIQPRYAGFRFAQLPASSIPSFSYLCNSMYALNKVSVHFTGEYLFRDISFIINNKDRVGLVGKNGAGKSTLLKIFAGILKPESGEVSKPTDATIGYLPQELVISSKVSVLEEAMKAFDQVLKLKDEIQRINQQITNPGAYSEDKYLELINKLTEKTEKYSLLDGPNIEAKTEKILAGLGFERKDFFRPMQEFSYGWQMRVELAKILLRQPRLLLLDEPTNHLDIESIQWLEEFLITYPGAVVLVSHDRALLDNVTKRTIEIVNGRIYDYKVPYSQFFELREERIEQQIAAYNNQQREMRQIERFIERFRYKNTKAKQVQSRIKMIEKMDKVEIDDCDESGIYFQFPDAPASGKIVVEADELSKSYGEHEVLQKIDFLALRGEKVAFVGRNGEGKSTLSKIITGHIPYSDGKLNIGHNVSVGYYAQNQAEMLNLEKSVFQTIDDIAVGGIRPKIRNILGSFLFGEEDIDKKVRVLSGGEKARLSLAKLLLTPANLLVLDEPTNHLDMQSKDILKNALLQYKGTLIIVSHDRDFLQGLTEKVIEFRNKKIREYLGDVYEFLRARKLTNLQQLDEKSGKSGLTKSTKVKSEGQNKWVQKKQRDREIRRLGNEVHAHENRIEQIEVRMGEIDEILGNPAEHSDLIESGDIYREYEGLKLEQEKVMHKWEKLSEELEKLRSRDQ